MPELVPPALTSFNAVLLLGTAFLAGGLNAVAGGGSFITFPTLIFTGVAPIAANATNNTAMWVAALASISAYRQDLNVERRLLAILSITSLIGGTIGSIALLYTAPGIFNKLIPYLLLLATIVFIFGEPLKKWSQTLSGESSTAHPSIVSLIFTQLIISIYGGFFGAGVGILMLASLTFSGVRNINAMNALKAFLGSCINGIAIVPFVLAGQIVWHQAVIMSVGGSIGSYVAARFARKIRSQIVRRFVAIVAIGMTVYFFVRG